MELTMVEIISTEYLVKMMTLEMSTSYYYYYNYSYAIILHGYFN